MEIESWWLLAIPLFFGLGWLAARLDLRSGGARTRGALPEAYFRGLNFLLNEQSDKAIDAFVDVVRIDPETVELHFALGSLFRRRGETDRAIRVHLNLVERRDLDASQREHALFELGQDYLKAGLLDRAEDAFNRLEGSRYAAAALHHRLEIAQMVRDWPLAIAHANRLERDCGERHGRDIAHFRCELAAVALKQGTPEGRDGARHEISAAIAADPEHPRPPLLAGEVARAEDDPEGAIAAWAPLVHKSPEFLALVAREWLAAHIAVGRFEVGLVAMERVQAEHPSVDTFAAIVDTLAQARSQEEALAWARSGLERQPSLLALERLLALHVPLADEQRRGDIELMQRVVQPQARRLARYVCRHCGFKARQFYWQCPGCSRWDTYAPKRTEEIERG